MAFATYLVFLFLSRLLLLNTSESKCQKPFKCGNFSMEFPFSDVNEADGCGQIKVDGCSPGNKPRILVKDGYGHYIVEQISRYAFKINDSEIQVPLQTKKCYSYRNATLFQSPSLSFTFYPNLTLFTCYNNTGTNEILEEYFQNYGRLDCEISRLYYNRSLTDVSHIEETSFPPGCSLTRLPVKYDGNLSDPFDLLSGEYTVEWSVSKECSKCYNGGGKCLTEYQNKFYCAQDGHTSFKILIGGVAAAVFSTSIILILFIRRKNALPRLFAFGKAQSRNEMDLELFLKNNGNLAPKRYKFSDIKKMTKSFRKNLGKGGYGSVYEGKSPDGHPVAVKILDESKENGEDFMNEVASISRTSHVNIVSLMGFCFEGSKRALIYEFMPNGSLEKFISNTATQGGLGCQKLFEIALGIARGFTTRNTNFSIRKLVSNAFTVTKILGFCIYSVAFDTILMLGIRNLLFDTVNLLASFIFRY